MVGMDGMVDLVRLAALVITIGPWIEGYYSGQAASRFCRLAGPLD
jgi:hypothetical protein